MREKRRMIPLLFLLQILIFMSFIGNLYYNSFLIPSSFNQVEFRNALQAQNGGEPPQQQWNVTWGGDLRDGGYDVALDDSNNLYLVGFTLSYSVAGDVDGLIVKYDSLGHQLWNRTFGDTGADSARGVVIDNSNNIYVCGSTYSISTGSYDAIIVKYDSDGNQIWNVSWSKPYYDCGEDIILDNDNNLYMVGVCDLSGSNQQLLLASFNSITGNERWNITYGASTQENGFGVAVDSLNYIYAAGFSAGTNGVLLKYNSSGDQEWVQQWGGSTWYYGQAVGVDNSDNVYLAGYTDALGSGLYDVFLVKYNSTGGELWNRILGWTKDEIIYDMKLNNTYLYLAGYTTSFETGSERDMLLIEYDIEGSQPWFITWDESPYDTIEGIAVKGNDIYLAGYIGIDVLERNASLIYCKLIDESPTPDGIPGFQLAFILIAMLSIIVVSKRKKYSENLDL